MTTTIPVKTIDDRVNAPLIFHSLPFGEPGSYVDLGSHGRMTIKQSRGTEWRYRRLWYDNAGIRNEHTATGFLSEGLAQLFAQSEAVRLRTMDELRKLVLRV